jgi:type IV secretion system protein VirB6
VLMGSNGSATMMFGDRIDIVFGAVDQIASSQNGNAEGGGAAAGPASMMSPQGIMYLGAVLLLLGTVGVLLTARIVLAVLLALGPVFVIMGVFSGTRGLTAGWVRGVVLTALTPLFVVLSGGISLELLVPILSRLNTSAQMGEIDGRAAMAFFLVSSVHVALMVLVMKITTTMVTGWQVFGLGVGERSRGEDRSYPSAQAAPAAGAGASAYAQAPAASASRSAAMVAAASAPAASVAAGGPGGDTTSSGERRTTVVTQISGGGIEPLRSSGTNARAKGIGSRFRSPSNDTGKTAGGSHARPPREMLR